MDVSRGAPFEYDVEKNQEMAKVSDRCISYSSSSNFLRIVFADKLPTDGYGPRRDGRLLVGEYRLARETCIEKTSDGFFRD